MAAQPTPIDEATRRGPARDRGRDGFTLIEIVLVLIILLIVAGISIPYFSHAYKGTKLRIAARTIDRMARYGRSMAIMRTETVSMVLDKKTMELYLGSTAPAQTNDAELDQEVLKRLGYVESSEPLVEKEIHHYLPDGIEVGDFKMDWSDENPERENQCVVNFYPDGKTDWFEMELKDQQGMSVKMENDPVSGKIYSEFKQ